METLNHELASPKAKKLEHTTTTNKEDRGAGLLSKFQQFSVSQAKATATERGAVVASPTTTSNRMLKLGSMGPTAFFTKTPKPPTVPRSRSFYQKSQRPLDTSCGRLGADGEAYEEMNTEDDDSVDYCSIERLPGDGCVSESTDEFSDGFEEEENEVSDGSENYNEEISCEGNLFNQQIFPGVKIYRLGPL